MWPFSFHDCALVWNVLSMPYIIAISARKSYSGRHVSAIWKEVFSFCAKAGIANNSKAAKKPFFVFIVPDNES